MTLRLTKLLTYLFLDSQPLNISIHKDLKITVKFMVMRLNLISSVLLENSISIIYTCY